MQAFPANTLFIWNEVQQQEMEKHGAEFIERLPQHVRPK